MALSILFLLLACAFDPTSGLQVTPNSGCSSVCMDDPSQDISDPNVSNTYGSSIVCNDADYNNTVVGNKFKECINCLQNSTASDSDSGETDTAWFLYNLRYAFDTCIYGYANATEPISTPCSTDTVCAPLQAALEDNMQDPSGGTQYSYCSASNSSFQSAALQPCSSCFRETADEVYFANFLVALQAGCVEQPKNGTLIGLDGTLFSQVPVNITLPITPNSSSGSHKPLSIGAIIGIAAGGVALLVAITALLFICVRKHRDRKRNSRIRSNFNERHGSRNISAPTKGAFVEPPATPPADYEDITLSKLYGAPQPRTKTTTLGKGNYRTANQHYERHKIRQQQRASGAGLGNNLSNSPPVDGRFLETPAPAYTPPGYGRNGPIQTGYVPYSNPDKSIGSSPASPPPSGSTVKRSSATTVSTMHSTSKWSPITVSGLPREPGVHNVSNPGIPRLQTRDLSVGRRGISIGTRTSPETSSISISGPMISVGSRFAEQEEASRRNDESPIRKRESEDSEAPEMWPGSY